MFGLLKGSHAPAESTGLRRLSKTTLHRVRPHLHTHSPKTSRRILTPRIGRWRKKTGWKTTRVRMPCCRAPVERSSERLVSGECGDRELARRESGELSTRSESQKISDRKKTSRRYFIENEETQIAEAPVRRTLRAVRCRSIGTKSSRW